MLLGSAESVGFAFNSASLDRFHHEPPPSVAPKQQSEGKCSLAGNRVPEIGLLQGQHLTAESTTLCHCPASQNADQAAPVPTRKNAQPQTHWVLLPRSINHMAVELTARPLRRTVSEEILRDVWEMSNCDMLLGSFVSSPFLLAWRLAAGRKGYFPPFISLETAPGNPVLGGWSQYKPGQPLYGKTCRCTDNSRRNVCRCDVLLEEFRNAAVSEGH